MSIVSWLVAVVPEHYDVSSWCSIIRSENDEKYVFLVGTGSHPVASITSCNLKYFGGIKIRMNVLKLNIPSTLVDMTGNNCSEI